jgi:hypothetical protein
MIVSANDSIEGVIIKKMVIVLILLLISNLLDNNITPTKVNAPIINDRIFTESNGGNLEYKNGMNNQEISGPQYPFTALLKSPA